MITKKKTLVKRSRQVPVAKPEPEVKPPKQDAVAVVDKALAPYTGKTPKGIEYREDTILVAIEDAPDDPAFPRLAKGEYPSDTYYAFNVKTRRCSHMHSIDAQGTGVSWDTDYSGRYFTRVSTPLRCPRYVEYIFDSANAISNGEVWGRTHPNYRGTLSSATGRPDSQPDQRHAPRHKKALHGNLAGKTKPSVIMPPPKKAAAPTKPAKTLRKIADTPKEERSSILTDKGLDKKALDDAAKDMSESWSELLGGDGETPKKRLVRKKTLRKKG